MANKLPLNISVTMNCVKCRHYETWITIEHMLENSSSIELDDQSYDYDGEDTLGHIDLIFTCPKCGNQSSKVLRDYGG